MAAVRNQRRNLISTYMTSPFHLTDTREDSFGRTICPPGFTFIAFRITLEVMKGFAHPRLRILTRPSLNRVNLVRRRKSAFTFNSFHMQILVCKESPRSLNWMPV